MKALNWNAIVLEMIVCATIIVCVAQCSGQPQRLTIRGWFSTTAPEEP